MLLVAALAGCARAPDVAAARATLLAADRAFNNATAERRTDGWVEFFAEDGAMIRSTGTVTGRAAIREEMSKAFADTAFSLRWEPLQSDAGATGDLGYTNGRYEARFRDAKGNAAMRTGRYLTVWKKQGDGSWKVVRDIGVQDPERMPRLRVLSSPLKRGGQPRTEARAAGLIAVSIVGVPALSGQGLRSSRRDHYSPSDLSACNAPQALPDGRPPGVGTLLRPPTT